MNHPATPPAGQGPGLHRVDGGRYTLAGPVGFNNAASLLAASARLFDGESVVEVDLAGVTTVDSAALALLLEWLSQAQGAGRRLHFSGVPEKLAALARLSGVEEMLASGVG